MGIYIKISDQYWFPLKILLLHTRKKRKFDQLLFYNTHVYFQYMS